MIGFRRSDAIAVLDEPEPVLAIAAAASDTGVMLRTDAPGAEIDLVAGAPDAVPSFVRGQARGLQPDLGRELDVIDADVPRLVRLVAADVEAVAAVAQAGGRRSLPIPDGTRLVARAGQAKRGR